MKLIDLMNLANKGYGDGMVAEYFDPVTGDFKPNPDGGDTLAQFVAAELVDTFDEKATSIEQLEGAISALNTAVCDLSLTRDRLQDELIKITVEGE